MTSRHAEWLATLDRAQKGGTKAELPPIIRGKPYSVVLLFAADYSASSFVAALGQNPDDGASKIADFDASAGVFMNGKIPVALSLTEQQTASVPADDDGDGVVTLVYDIFRNDPDGSSDLEAAGFVQVIGRVGND